MGVWGMSECLSERLVARKKGGNTERRNVDKTTMDKVACESGSESGWNVEKANGI